MSENPRYNRSNRVVNNMQEPDQNFSRSSLKYSRTEQSRLLYPPEYQLIQDHTKTNLSEVLVNISDIWRIIRKNIIFLILMIILSGAAYGFIKSYLDPAQYESTATIFLTPKFDSDGELDQSSISTNRTLLSNAIALMTRDNIIVQVAEKIENMTPDEIRETLTVEPISGTELISVTSTSTDPQISKNIVDTTVSAFIDTMKDNLNLDNITVVDQPKLDYTSVSTPIYVYFLQGTALGILIDIFYVFIRVIMNKRLRTKEEAEKYLGVPVFVVLPDIGKR